MIENSSVNLQLNSTNPEESKLIMLQNIKVDD